MNKLRVTRGIAKTVIAVAAVATVAFGWLTVRGTAFNPQPDPPGFGLVTLVTGQSIRVNVVCSEHAAGRFPPDPCSGEIMFHDMAGNTLASQQIRLMPGQAASVPLTLLPREVGGPVGIDPCWVPSADNSGIAIPSAEVFSTETGRTMLFLNPAVARLGQLDINPLRGGR